MCPKSNNSTAFFFPQARRLSRISRFFPLLKEKRQNYGSIRDYEFKQEKIWQKNEKYADPVSKEFYVLGKRTFIRIFCGGLRLLVV